MRAVPPLLALTTALASTPGALAVVDVDGDGYIGLADYRKCQACLASSGPGRPADPGECPAGFDTDVDGDADLADFAAFQRARGHLPIPLRDVLGNVIHMESTR